MRNIKGLVVAVALLFSSSLILASAPPSFIKLNTKLSGASIGGRTAEGRAVYQGYLPMRFRLLIDVNHVNENIGTVLTVSVDQSPVGTIVVRCPYSIVDGYNPSQEDCEEGDLELDSFEFGDIVPTIGIGSVITITDPPSMNHPNGITILAGVFGPLPNKRTRSAGGN
jgi:hypothetical protein